jgi:hypothetical protein
MIPAILIKRNPKIDSRQLVCFWIVLFLDRNNYNHSVYTFYMKLSVLSPSLYILMLLILFTACIEDQKSINSATVEQSFDAVPDFNPEKIKSTQNGYKYEIASTPTYEDLLILTKNGKKIQQERQIKIKKETNSIILNLPKSFAKTTDDLSISFKDKSTDVEWNVIKKDPIIELINIKKEQINKAISIKTAVNLLDKGQDFFEVAQKQAKLHQVHQLLQKVDDLESEALQELYVLAVIAKYPKVFEGSVEILGDNACDYFEDKIKANICRAIQNGKTAVCEQYQGDRKEDCQHYLFMSMLAQAGPNVSDDKLLEIIKKSGYRNACAPLEGDLKRKCTAIFESSSKENQKGEESSDQIIISSKMEDIYNAPVDCADLASGARVHKTACWDPDDVRLRVWPKGEIQCDLRFEAMEYPNHCIINIRPYKTEAEFLSHHKSEFRDNPKEFRKVVSHGEKAVYVTEFYKLNRIFIQCGKNVPYEEVNAKARELIDRKMPLK